MFSVRNLSMDIAHKISTFLKCLKSCPYIFIVLQEKRIKCLLMNLIAFNQGIDKIRKHPVIYLILIRRTPRISIKYIKMKLDIALKWPVTIHEHFNIIWSMKIMYHDKVYCCFRAKPNLLPSTWDSTTNKYFLIWWIYVLKWRVCHSNEF